MERKRNLFREAGRQQEASFDEALEIGRRAVDRTFEESNEPQRIQRSLDAIARSRFRDTFKLNPEQSGQLEFEHQKGAFTLPVFSIDFANVVFQPGSKAIDALAAKDGLSLPSKRSKISLFKRSSNDAQKDEDEDLIRRDIGAWITAYKYGRFEAVSVCSGCQNWAPLLSFEETLEESLRKKGMLRRQPHYKLEAKGPPINAFEDVAANTALFNEAISGLAYDCDKIPVFELKLSTISAIIACPKVQEVLASRKDILSAYKKPYEKVD